MKGQMKSALMEMSLQNADYERKSEFEKDFKFNRKLKDPRFGEVSLIQNPKTRQFLAVKEKKINDKKEAGKAIVNARKRMTNKHDSILSLVDYSVTKQSELCSSFFVLKLFYDFPRSDINREIQERQKKGEGFSDAELTHILYQQIAANNYLQSKDQHHGDIQPLNIAYDKTNFQSKLIDMSEDASTLNSSKQKQKNRVVAGHPLYQSPTTYSNLKKGNLNYTVDPNKEDVYALGLTLLEAGNGRSIQNIYNANTKEVDQQALQAHIEDFKRRHSNENTLLTTTIETMLHPEEEQRPSFRDLENKLPPYETVQQFLKDRQENKVHGALQNEQFNAQTNVEVKTQDNNVDWNFGQSDQNNFNFVQPRAEAQVKSENIQLVNMPHFGSQQQNNVEQFNPNFNYQSENKVQAGSNAFPMQTQPSERKVILASDNNNYVSGNFNQPQNYNVQTVTQEPIIRRSYVVNETPSYIQSNQNVSTNYQSVPDNSYNYSVSSQPRVEYVKMEPEYRKEYIPADKNMEKNQNVVYSTPQNYVKKDYAEVRNEPYIASQSEIKTYSYQAPQNETKTYTYQVPQNESKTYTYQTSQNEIKTYSYQAPQNETKTYTYQAPQNEVKTYSYQAPQNETKTYTYQAPQNETKTYTYQTPQNEVKTYTYQAPENETKTYTYQTPQNEVKTYTYQAPQNEAQTYTYQAPQNETKTYTYQAPENEVKTYSYQAPQNEVKTYTYQAPENEAKTYTYQAPQNEAQTYTYQAPQNETKTYTYQAPQEIRRSYVSYQNNPTTYSTGEIKYNYVNPEVKSTNYVAPETRNVQYSQRKSIGRTYVTDSQPVTYTNEVRRSYVNPENRTVSYTNSYQTNYQTVGYNIPQENVVKRVSYREPSKTQYTSERVVENPVRNENNPEVQTEISGMKLVKTYQDNNNSTRVI